MTTKRHPWESLPGYRILALLLAFSISSWSCKETNSNSPEVAAVTQFDGSFDKLAVESVGGWAWDAERPNEAIMVEIYDGATLLSKVTASEFREDLKTAGKGDGKHAFNFAMPQALRDGQSHSISVKYSGTDSHLPGSPKSLIFPKP